MLSADAAVPEDLTEAGGLPSKLMWLLAEGISSLPHGPFHGAVCYMASPRLRDDRG